MSVLVIPALFIRKVLDLAYDADYYKLITADESYYGYTKSFLDLNWADNYIYVISVMAIALGLGIIACLRPRDSAYNSQHQKNMGYDQTTQVQHAY